MNIGETIGEVFLTANKFTPTGEVKWKYKVVINKLETKMAKRDDLAFTPNVPAVGIEINYGERVNVFIFSETDVIKIVDIWMGGMDESTELSEMHESAAGELVYQIVRQADTPLKELLNIPVNMDISNRRTFRIDGDYNIGISEAAVGDTVTLTKLKLLVDDFISGEILVISSDAFKK